jgi:tetratricopeptide (TPR) repeat protein
MPKPGKHGAPSWKVSSVFRRVAQVRKRFLRRVAQVRERVWELTWDQAEFLSPGRLFAKTGQTWDISHETWATTPRIEAYVTEGAPSAKKETTNVRDASPRSSFAAVIEKLQRYWFLVTVLASLFTWIFYMAVFQVTPWAPFSEAKQRRQLVGFLDRTGYGMLEQGQYQLAKTQFERALKLKESDHAASVGSYMADLFIDLQSQDPNVASVAIIQHLTELSSGETRKDFPPIVEKYLGDAYAMRGDAESAQEHYENAISLNPHYLAALDAYGWLSYSQLPDLSRMQQLFTRMTKVDEEDYRGYFGLGYALYMQATKESDPGRRQQLILEAAEQSRRAESLKVVYLNVLGAFGEIARSVNPDLAIALDEAANHFLDDPEIMTLPNNKGGYLTQLLTDQGQVFIRTASEKRAWICYQLALDHLARYRLRTPPNENDPKQHDDLFKRALSLDPERNILRIYKDQRQILDLLLATKALTVGAGPP